MLYTSSDDLPRYFPVDGPAPWVSSYNIAPTQAVLAVQAARNGARWSLFQWGLVPGWAKDPSIGSRMINARSETALEKPSYRIAFRYRRCILPADGFLEWQKVGKTKQPYLISLKTGEPFGMAGIWEHWHSPDGSELQSCSILTTNANAIVAPLHDRMPVILDPKSYDDWLFTDPSHAARLQSLLQPFPPELMRAYPVSTAVNNADNNWPELAEAIET